MEFKINDLTKTYNNKIALDQFTYTFGKGVYGILGPNGAGKSTLMKLITDSINRETGSIMIDGKDILDMGCGTSILAILGMKRGANYAECIDIDEWAVENSIENGKRNGVSLDAKMGDNSLLGSKQFDIILANINKNILISQIPSYINVLNENGDLFLSGLMEQDFDDILAFCTENGLKFVSKKQRNEWIALHFKK